MARKPWQIDYYWRHRDEILAKRRVPGACERRLSRALNSNPPTLRPTTADIAWAAAIFEGEGSAYSSCLRVVQKDPWILERLQALFGGSIQYVRRDPPRYGVYQWTLSRIRGRGLLMTIYKSLSPRRRAQVRKALRGARVYWWQTSMAATRIGCELRWLGKFFPPANIEDGMAVGAGGQPKDRGPFTLRFPFPAERSLP